MLFNSLLAACSPKCTPKCGDACPIPGRCYFTWDQFIGNGPLPSTMLPAGPNQPHTKCVLALSLVDWMKAQPTFRLNRLLKDGRPLAATSRNYAYIKVRANGFDGMDREFYLHTLLCYMYRGPPPDPSFVAGHLCHHKCCLAPWHLDWVPKSVDVSMGLAHTRQSDYGNYV
jgi:hypothetical protein